MGKAYSYLIKKGGKKYIRIVDGELADKVVLDYQNATLKELQMTMAFVLKYIYRSNTEEGKILQKIGINSLIICRSEHYIKLAKDDDPRDIRLLNVTEFLLNEFSTNVKNIYLNRILLR